MARPEQQIHKAVIQHLDQRGVRGLWFTHIPNGGFRRPIEAAIFKGLGLKPGAPDLLIVHDGRAYFLELKATDGKLTMPQVNCHSALRAAGAAVATAYGLDEALRQLEVWGLLAGTAQGRAAWGNETTKFNRPELEAAE